MVLLKGKTSFHRLESVPNNTHGEQSKYSPLRTCKNAVALIALPVMSILIFSRFN